MKMKYELETEYPCTCKCGGRACVVNPKNRPEATGYACRECLTAVKKERK